MEASEVVDAAHEFLLRISQLVPPEHLHVSLCSSGGRLRSVATHRDLILLLRLKIKS